jgi:hypothetical protein
LTQHFCSCQSAFINTCIFFPFVSNTPGRFALFGRSVCQTKKPTPTLKFFTHNHFLFLSFFTNTIKTKRSWSNLPAEILQPIFKLVLHIPDPAPIDQNIAVRDVGQCQLVCKKWGKIAQFEIYIDVAQYTSLSAQLFNRSIKNNIELAAYATKFFLCFLKDLEQTCLGQLLANLISLEHLESVNVRTSLYSQLIHAHGKLRLKNLKRLPRPWKTEELKPYMTCALVF